MQEIAPILLMEVGPMRGISKSLALVALAALMTLPPVAVTAGGIGFGFHFGDEPDDFYPPLAICLTDRQIRLSLADRGYSEIFLNVPNDGKIQVRARRGDWLYLIDFDYCRDRIDGVSRLRPAG